MGAWFADFLSKNGYRVLISYKNDRHGRNLARQKRVRFIKDSRLVVQPAQLVVLATPTEAVGNNYYNSSSRGRSAAGFLSLFLSQST
jgi:prephenate dehydrogenase